MKKNNAAALFDALKARHGLDSDAALRRELEILPANISLMRKGMPVIAIPALLAVQTGSDAPQSHIDGLIMLLETQLASFRSHVAMPIPPARIQHWENVKKDLVRAQHDVPVTVQQVLP